MKKTIIILLAMLLTALILSGCGEPIQEEQNQQMQNEEITNEVPQNEIPEYNEYPAYTDETEIYSELDDALESMESETDNEGITEELENYLNETA
ncbi:MAG: hypothetical protein JW703_05430 [Candidatus Diapherotrites archaeon]|nr:hypothetical protein [Candidatus Diapherotrites archaeon]